MSVSERAGELQGQAAMAAAARAPASSDVPDETAEPIRPAAKLGVRDTIPLIGILIVGFAISLIVAWLMQRLLGDLAQALPQGTLDSFHSQLLAPIIAGTGFLITVLIGIRLRHTERNAERANDLARQLAYRNDTLAQHIAERDQFARALETSEQKLKLILEQLSSAVFEIDESGKLRFLNSSWTSITGHSVADAVGRPAADFLMEGDPETLRASIEDLRRNPDHIMRRVLQVRSADGDVVPLEIAARWVAGSDGAGAGRIIGAGHDIGERLRAEEALRAAEQNFRVIFENTPIGLFQTTREGRFMAANRAMAEILGYPSPSDLVRTMTDFARQAFLRPEQFEAIVARADAADGQQVSAELEAVRRDGREIWLQTTLRASEAGAEMHYEGTAKDVTDQRAAETALVAAKEQADLASRAKTEFLANMSHELRTPLNAIIGFSEIIKDEMFGQIEKSEYLDYARDIYDAGSHLLNIINDILDVAKIEAGKRDLIEGVVDFQRVTHACFRLMRSRAEQGQVRLVSELPAQLPAVRGDEQALKQVMLNLLSNAVKFTPEGGAVTVQGQVEPDGKLRIAVKDTGIGIASADLDKVLQPFGQVENAFSRRHQGTGLGLTLVQALTHMHGGWFRLESAIGQGTTANFWLPSERVIRAVA